VSVHLKGFLVSALTSALELGLARGQDILVHVTPDVLAASLPRPLWARLIAACMGAPRVDAALVVETIGVANLCEHVPSPLMWACVRDIATRALGGQIVAAPPPVMTSATTAAATARATSATVAAASSSATAPSPAAVVPPPPPMAAPTPTPAAPVAVGPNIPAPTTATASAEDEPLPLTTRSRNATRPPFRQAATGIGNRAPTPVAARRPQAQAVSTGAPMPGGRTAPPGPAPRRGQTDADFDLDTDVKQEWKPADAIAVEEEQLVDWASSEETVTSGPGYDPRAKR
jgi:hypothetical protein